MKLNKKVLGLAVVVAMASTSAFAVSQFGNNSQRGSLMIFPRIDISGANDTLITMVSDYQGADVRVKCYYVTPSKEGYKGRKNLQDFQITLTHNQPTYWWARHGGNGAPPFSPMPNGEEVEKGEMKCWAVDRNSGEEIHFNHLFGTASVIDDKTNQAYEYTAWTFQALEGGASTANTFNKLGSPGVLKLDNAEYDACPNQLLGSFFPGKHIFHPSKTLITVAGCTEDLRQDRLPVYTKLNYTFWNEDEDARTGTYECMDSWYEADLDKFVQGTYPNLQTDVAYFRVFAAPSTVCGSTSAQVQPGIVGVKAEWATSRFIPVDASILPGVYNLRGTNLTGRGENTSNTIQWDTPYERK